MLLGISPSLLFFCTVGKELLHLLLLYVVGNLEIRMSLTCIPLTHSRKLYCPLLN